MIGKIVFFAETIQLCLQQGFLVDVFTFFIFFLNPEMRIHLLNLKWHQSRENRISGILCGCWQDTAIGFFFGERIKFT